MEIPATARIKVQRVFILKIDEESKIKNSKWQECECIWWAYCCSWCCRWFEWWRCTEWLEEVKTYIAFNDSLILYWHHDNCNHVPKHQTVLIECYHLTLETSRIAVFQGFTVDMNPNELISFTLYDLFWLEVTLHWGVIYYVLLKFSAVILSDLPSWALIVLRDPGAELTGLLD